MLSQRLVQGMERIQLGQDKEVWAAQGDMQEVANILWQFCASAPIPSASTKVGLEQWFSVALQNAINSVLNERISVSDSEHEGNDLISRRQKPGSSADTCVVYRHSESRSIFGTVLFITRTTYRVVFTSVSTVGERTDEKVNSQISIIYHPSQWLLKLRVGWGLVAAVQTSSVGWKFKMSSTCPVPDDSLVFEFCKNGNIDGVRLLFDRREASPMDVDSRGYTPLHVCDDVSQDVQIFRANENISLLPATAVQCCVGS
jgi:hypothetical protein